MTNSNRRLTTTLALAMTLFTFAACSPSAPADGGDASADGAACDFLGCSGDQAPLRTGDGGMQCTPVGADLTAAPSDWPDVSMAPAPVIYVRAGSSGGDGSMGSPLGDLAAAITAHPEANTFALARGNYPLTSRLVLARTLTLVGAGASSATTIVPPSGGDGLYISGAATIVTLAHLAIGYSPAATAGAGALVEMQGQLSIDQVEIDDAFEGLRVAGGSVHASGLSIRRAVHRGIALLPGGAMGAPTRANFDSVLVRDGAGVGILADGATFTIAHAYVVNNAGDGLAVLEGFPSTVSDTAVVCNTTTGVRVQLAGAMLTGARWTVSGTRAAPGMPGGDGIFVGGGGSLVLDTPPAGGWTGAMEGTQSWIAHNARTGMLVSGDPTGATSPGHADVFGVTIASNQGPGVFVQQHASIGTLGFSRIDDNLALGIGVTSGASIVALACDAAQGTRMGVLETDMGSVTLGDGLSIADQASSVVTDVHENHFDNNARFGAVFANASARLANNTGSGNGFAIGSYAATVIDSGGNTVGGAAAPATASIARGSVGGP